MKLVLAQVLLALVSGQSLEENMETSPVPDLMAQGMAVGLVEPTSPWVQAVAKETSPEAQIATATGASLNLLMAGGAEGDLHGATPRNNMVYFGVGRHGVSFGDHCDGLCDSGHQGHHGGAAPCGAAPHGAASHGAAPRGSAARGTAVHGAQHQESYATPYLKVTPRISVDTVTKTFVQTCLQTSLEVLPYLVTRTVTESLRTTKTHVAKPEITHTYVERQTIYEYPASTIMGDAVKCATSLAPASTAHTQND